MRPSRLRVKLFLAFWTATSLSFLIAIGLLRLSHDSRDERHGPEAGFVLDNAALTIRREGVEAARPLLRNWEQRPGDELGLYDAAGRLLEGRAVAGSPGGGRWVEAADGQRYRLVSVREPHEPGPPPVPITPLVIGTLVSVLFSALLAWYLSRPLLHLGRALRAMAEGHLDTRVRPLMGGRRDEIVDLAGDFDRMAAQLQQLLAAQQRLLHDISHELRSPLTRLQAAIALLRQRPVQGESMLARIERESQRLDELIEELLTLSRLEAGAGSIDRERVDLIELLSAIAEDASFEAETRGCRVSLVAEGRFVSWVSGEMLYRALENVVRNAVKFTAPGTAVDIVATVDPQAQQLEIFVRDRGPGVPEEMLESIFEPFKRADHDGPVQGFGLGLAIARRAVEMHGGIIRARAAEGGGLSVSLSIPQGREIADGPPR